MSSPSRTAGPPSPDETSVPSTDDPTGGQASARPRRRWLLVGSLGILLVVAVVFAAATLRLFVFPATDQPTHVNGILSLNGGNEMAREALAVSLAEKGYAPVLLFSQGGEASDTSCPKVPRVAVVCFVDGAGNTRRRGGIRGALRRTPSLAQHDDRAGPGSGHPGPRAHGAMLLGTCRRRSHLRVAPCAAGHRASVGRPARYLPRPQGLLKDA